MGGLLMVESLAQKSKTRCVVFLTGEGLDPGRHLETPWAKELSESLPDSMFEKVFSSRGERDDRRQMRLSDIVVFCNERAVNFGSQSLVEFGMASMLERPIFVFNKLHVGSSDEVMPFIRHGSSSLREVIMEVRREGMIVLKQKVRATENAK